MQTDPVVIPQFSFGILLCPKKIMPCLCGYFGRSVALSVSVFTQLQR